MGTTEKLAEFVVRTTSKDISRETIRVAQEHCLDCIGVTLPGSQHEVGKIITKVTKVSDSAHEAGVIAGGFRTSTTNAALANGTMAHALDYDDHAWLNPINPSHPSVVIVPTVLALGEKLNCSGQEIVTAYILGTEIWAKIGLHCSPAAHSIGWHPTGLFGTIGAAAASAKLLKLNVEETRIAFGIACSETGSLRRNFGTMTKPLHAGMAASNGVLAGLLAKEGFTANPDVFDDTNAFSGTFFRGGKCECTKMTENLGNPFTIEKRQPGIKRYPCPGCNANGLDASMELLKAHDISYDDIELLEAHVNPFVPSILTYPEPKTGLEAKFSAEYNLAATIRDRKLNLASYAEEKVTSPQMREALKKINVIVHPDWPPRVGGTKIIIKLKDGTIFNNQVEMWKGSPDNPLSREELTEKYRDCAQSVLTPKETEESIELLLNLSELDDIKVLMDILIGACKTN
ncbi:MAG: MmgE/PrpD family protein [Desulfobacteraceae bacterium]|nr:MmgE/PrpD family protein [Desulfobacteraceae bacterium]